MLRRARVCSVKRLMLLLAAATAAATDDRF